MQNVFNVCALRTNWLKILILEDLVWIQVFLKNFSSHTHAFHSWSIVLWGVSALNCSVFFKNLIFPDFWSIKSVSRPIEIENFSVFKFLNNFFFHASFMFRIHMQCIVFCIHLAVLQSYLSLFLHITCIHFAKLGTQFDLRIDWLKFELCTF